MKISKSLAILAVFTLPLGLFADQALSLFETPRDGSAPLLTAIGKAQHTIDVEVYELTDEDIVDALIKRSPEQTTMINLAAILI